MRWTLTLTLIKVNFKQEAAPDGVRCLPPQPEGYDLVIEGDGFLYKMVPPTPYPDP